MSDSGASSILLDQDGTQRQSWHRLPDVLFKTFLTFDVLFVVLYALAVALRFTHSRYFGLVDLDAEANAPAWYSGVQLFVVAIGFYALWSRLIPQRRKIEILRPLWILLGVAFTFLSMDEVASIHERIGSLLWHAKVFNHMGLGDQWMWLYVVIAIVLIVVYRKQLAIVWHEWPSETKMFVFGFAVLIFGGVILEAVHLRLAHHIIGYWNNVEIAFEEGLEMLGATILLVPVFRTLAYAVTGEPAAVPAAVGKHQE